METVPSLIEDCIKNKKRLARENAQVQQNITSINRQGPVFPKQQTTSNLREVQNDPRDSLRNFHSIYPFEFIPFTFHFVSNRIIQLLN